MVHVHYVLTVSSQMEICDPGTSAIYARRSCIIIFSDAVLHMKNMARSNVKVVVEDSPIFQTQNQKIMKTFK